MQTKKDLPSQIHSKIKENDEEFVKIIRTESEKNEDEWMDDFEENSCQKLMLPPETESILAARERIAFNQVLPFVLKAQTYRIILFSIITAILAALEFHFTETNENNGDEIEIIYQPSKALAGIFTTIGFLLAVLTQKPSLGLPYVSFMLFISTTNYFELIKTVILRYGNGFNFQLANLIWLIFFLSTDLSLILTVSKILYYEWTIRCMKSFNEKLYEIDDFCKKKKKYY